MDGTRSKYPCKAFPYKRLAFGIQYPCRKFTNEVEVIEPLRVVEPAAFRVEEEPRTMARTEGVNCPPLKRKCSFPYFRSCRYYCRHQFHRRNVTPKWHRQFLNKLEREKEDLVCISPAMKDSYEVICSIPLCEPKAPVIIKLRKPFNPVHCVFCNKSLYTGGTICDVQDIVPAIQRQSTDQGDDIADRIGLRTRITVHKSCFDNYMKRAVRYLLDYDPDGCHPVDSPSARQL